jgi:L-amino acid N-acyltransferase YncA
MVRKMSQDDSYSILDIYRMGLETRNATFETTVFEENGVVAGWAALTPVSSREVYRGVAELSIYVAMGLRGKQIGSSLMEQVIISSELNGIWTLCSSVFPENEATIRLHKKFGFREIGRRERIAKLDNQWRDTILFERRSSRIY